MSRRADPYRSRPNGGAYGNGYANGYGTGNGGDDYDPYNSNSYDSGNDIFRPPRNPEPPAAPSASRRDRRVGRAGGYGGFAFEPEEEERDEQERVQRPSSLERMGAKRRSGGSPRAFAGRDRRGGAMYGRAMDLNGVGGRQMQGQCFSLLKKGFSQGYTTGTSLSTSTQDA